MSEVSLRQKIEASFPGATVIQVFDISGGCGASFEVGLPLTSPSDEPRSGMMMSLWVLRTGPGGVGGICRQGDISKTPVGQPAPSGGDCRAARFHAGAYPPGFATLSVLQVLTPCVMRAEDVYAEAVRGARAEGGSVTRSSGVGRHVTTFASASLLQQTDSIPSATCSVPAQRHPPCSVLMNTTSSPFSTWHSIPPGSLTSQSSPPTTANTPGLRSHRGPGEANISGDEARGRRREMRCRRVYGGGRTRRRVSWLSNNAARPPLYARSVHTSCQRAWSSILRAVASVPEFDEDLEAFRVLVCGLGRRCI